MRLENVLLIIVNFKVRIYKNIRGFVVMNVNRE